jgi:predicted secreted protein
MFRPVQLTIPSKPRGNHHISMDAVVSAGLVLVAIFIIFAGCIGGPGGLPAVTHVVTDLPEEALPVTSVAVSELPVAGNNSGSVSLAPATLPMGGTITIAIGEESGQGYHWNATVTDGLVIENESHARDPQCPAAPGCPILHLWQVKAEKRGSQIFAVVKWEDSDSFTGPETRYTVAITVR